MPGDCADEEERPARSPIRPVARTLTPLWICRISSSAIIHYATVHRGQLLASDLLFGLGLAVLMVFAAGLYRIIRRAEATPAGSRWPRWRAWLPAGDWWPGDRPSLEQDQGGGSLGDRYSTPSSLRAS